MITIYEANKVNMIDLLKKLNEPIVKKGKRYKWPTHYSIEFKNNMWYQHSKNRGGLPLDFLDIFFNMNKASALKFISEHFDTKYLKSTNTYSPSLQVPHAADSNVDVIFYLNYFRNIDESLIRTFINNNLIYQEHKYNNVLFVGKSRSGEIKHIHRRSTHNSDLVINNNLRGSSSEYSFNLIGKSRKLFVFESPIDLMSYLELNPDEWSIHSYVALCGLSSTSVHRILKDYHYINKVILCLDNDSAGIDATLTISKELSNKNIIVKQHFPTFKDFNEDLKFSKGLPAKEGFIEPASKLYEKCLSIALKQSQDIKNARLKDIRNAFSKFVYTYKEDEPVSKFTYQALINTASLSIQFIIQQYSHLEKQMDINSLREKLLENDNLHAYIDTRQNLTTMSYNLNELQDYFSNKTFHSKSDKLQIINILMSLTNILVYTHVFLCLNERNKQK